MSVPFDRITLRKVAQTALDNHASAVKLYDQYRASVIKAYEEEQTEKTRNNATRLRDALTKALKKPGPIYLKEVQKALPRGDYLSYSFYTPPANHNIDPQVTPPNGLLKPEQLEDTRALIALLDSSVAESISANELRVLGLKNLRSVLVAASTVIAHDDKDKQK